MSKFLRRMFFGLLVLAGIFVAGLWALLGTEAGTSWTLRQIEANAPDTVQISEHEGKFLGRLTMKNVSLKLGQSELNIASLLLDWSPAALLKRELLINLTEVQGLRFLGGPPTDEAESESLEFPIELPAVSIPIKLTIRQLRIEDASIIPGPKSPPLEMAQLLLAAHWDDEGLTISRLDADGSGVTLSISGQIKPSGSYVHALENRVEFDIEGVPKLTLTGTMRGDKELVEISQMVSGEIDLALQGSLQQPLEKPAWEALVDINSIPGELLHPQLPLTLRGQLESAGNLDSINASGKLATDGKTREFDLDARLDIEASIPDERVVIRQFTLAQRELPGKISLSGDLSLQSDSSLQGQWEALQWPLSGTPVINSTAGNFTVTGSIEDYRIDLATELAGKNIPTGSWSIAAMGNSEQLRIDALKAALLGGEASTNGVLTWSPDITWDLKAQGRNLAPEGVVPDLTGKIDFDTLVTGQLADQGPEATLVIEQLSGELNGFPLAGKGSLHYKTDLIEITELKVNSADAVLAANGSIGPQSDLQLNIEVPELNQLLKEAEGNFTLKGSVSGPQSQPRVAGTIAAGDLSFRTLAAEQFNADFDVDLSDNQRSTISASGRSLTAAENMLNQFDINASGLISDHEIQLAADHESGKLSSVISAGYKEDVWSGSLNKMDLLSEPFGQWNLQQPVVFKLSTAQSMVELFCLQREAARLCGEGHWQADGPANASFNLAKLPLNWLQPVLPENIRDLTGNLNVDGKISQDGSLKADVTGKITPGEFAFLAAKGEQRMRHQGADLEFNTTEKGAKGKLQAGIGPSNLTADFSLPDLQSVADPMTAQLVANLILNAPDLSFVPLFVPQITEIEGDIKTDMDLSGSLAKPNIRGGAKIALPSLRIPSAGLHLSDSSLDMAVSDNSIKVDGRLNSGGTINIDGDINLDAEQSWPLSMTIAGNDFVAVDLPNIQIVINPDIKIERDSSALSVKGDITIPKAEILIRDIPAGARSASDDVVVVRGDASQDTEQSTALPLNTDLNLILGDRVRVSALGLDATFGGELRLHSNAGEPLLGTGDIRILEGNYRAYSQDLEIVRGIISYTNSPLDNPGLNIQATRTIGDVIVGINALGTARRTNITTFSTPSMSENNRISYLVTGAPSDEGAKLSFNRQVSKKISVGVTVDTETGERALVTRYRINRRLHTEVTSKAESSALDLFYTIERE